MLRKFFWFSETFPGAIGHVQLRRARKSKPARRRTVPTLLTHDTSQTKQLGKGTPETCKLLGAELEVRGRRKHLIWIVDDGSRPWHSPTPVIVANACAAGSRGSPPIAAQLLKRTGAGPGGPNEHCLPRRHWGAVAWPDGYRISIRGVRWIGSRSY